jgi:hypothetical protein
MKVRCTFKGGIQMMTSMSSVVEEDTKGKRVAYKDMHTLY